MLADGTDGCRYFLETYSVLKTNNDVIFVLFMGSVHSFECHLSIALIHEVMILIM